MISELPPVQQVISGEVDLLELAGRIYETLTTQQRLHSLSSSGGLLQQPGPRSVMVGWRCIVVWSLQGGAGKSTLSASLALEAAERRLPTLLSGLGAPDVLPLRLGFDRPAPNLLNWIADPHARGPAPGRAPVRRPRCACGLSRPGRAGPLSARRYIASHGVARVGQHRGPRHVVPFSGIHPMLNRVRDS